MTHRRLDTIISSLDLPGGTLDGVTITNRIVPMRGDNAKPVDVIKKATRDGIVLGTLGTQYY